MNTKNYESPFVETMEIKTEGCLCSSQKEGYSNEAYDMENIDTYQW